MNLGTQKRPSLITTAFLIAAAKGSIELRLR